MKTYKIFLSVMLSAILLVPISNVSAQGLSEQDKSVIYPQLSLALGAIASTVSSLQTEINREDMVMSNDMSLMQSFGVLLTSVPPPSINTVVSMTDSLKNMSGDVAEIDGMRANMIGIMQNIVTTLNSIFKSIQ